MLRLFRQFRKGRAAHRIVIFGWPLVLASLSQTILTNMDTAMVGRLSLDALAALGVASTVMHFFIIVGLGLAFGLSASVSAELGTRSFGRSGRVVITGIQISFLAGPLVAVWVWFTAPWIYRTMGLEGNVFSLAIDYTRIFCGFLVLSPLQACLNSTFAAHTHTRVIMFTSVTMATVNAFGNYVLIFGKWGFPALGIRGAAIASIVSIGVSVAILASILWFRRRKYYLNQVSAERGFAHYAARICRLGMTTVAEWMLWFGGILLLNALVVRCGTAEVALFNVGIKMQSMLMLCMSGVVGANSAMVSRAVGARRPKRIRMWTATALWVGELSIIPGWLLLLFFPELVLRIYMRAQDIALLENVQAAGIVLALLIVVRVNNTTAGTTLRCMGILRYFLICIFVSTLIMLSVCSVTIGVLKWGAVAAFAGTLLEEGIRAVLYWRKLIPTLESGAFAKK